MLCLFVKDLWHIYLFRILKQKKESKEKSEILELDPWNMFLLLFGLKNRKHYAQDMKLEK